VTKRFVPPPNWPTSPPGWQPPAGWRPDPRWGPAPYGWQFWQEEPKRSWVARHKVATTLLATPMALMVGLFGLGAVGATVSEPATFASVDTEQTVTPSPRSTAAARPSPSQMLPDRAEASASASAEAAAAQAAQERAAAEQSAKVKAAKVKAAKVKAAKAKAAKAKAAKAKAAKAKAIKAKAAKARAEEEAADDCTPGYSPCLPYASDYDCSGGSGNGPEYVYGSVRVTGSDPYDLDRDGDGVGCD
jgi:hypothetical protein